VSTPGWRRAVEFVLKRSCAAAGADDRSVADLVVGSLQCPHEAIVMSCTLRRMAGLTPYIHFPGTAREALSFYADVFGGLVQSHTFAEFGRTDGPADAIAHGYLVDASLSLYAADVAGEEAAFRAQGLMLSLLGTAEPATLRRWFARLDEEGEVIDELQERPWGASDGQVIDRNGLHWLIGFEHDTSG